MRSLEAQGVPQKQAEAITSAITHVLVDSMENISQAFVTKSQMQKVHLYLCLFCFLKYVGLYIKFLHALYATY